MEYMGLFHKYKVNRRLTDKEREHKLDPKVKLEVQPIHQLTVLRMNSTYLETVDKYDAWRGWVIIISAVILVVSVTMIVATLREWFSPDLTLDKHSMLWVFLICGFSTLLPSLWLFLKEAFTWCYYPIRFNRKTRKVHVTRLNGTVLTVGWDEVFFTLTTTGMGSLGASHWEIQGHVLGEDRETVKETFALAFWGLEENGQPNTVVRMYWEFIRRYMEEGPASVDNVLRQCSPVLFRRETWWYGFQRFNFNFYQRWVALILGLPFSVLDAFGRQIALRSSRLPKWLAEVEAECVIEPDDPYERDARHNKHDLWGMKVWPSQKPLW